MLLADARLPTGGHAHSAGVEPALLGGMPATDVPALIRGRAVTASLVDAGTAVVARHRFATDGDVTAVVGAWAARTPSAALREASRLLGRGYLRLAGRVWGGHPAIVRCAELNTPPRPVVLGAIACAAGLDAADLARLAVYDDAQAAAAALLKLEPTDPAVPITWVLDACAAAEPRIPGVAALTDPVDIPCDGAPQSEAWAQAHAELTRRLFRA
jgi:urease accessory protein